MLFMTAYMTGVEGEHVQDVMRQCCWDEPERGEAGTQKREGDRKKGGREREKEMCG